MTATVNVSGAQLVCPDLTSPDVMCKHRDPSTEPWAIRTQAAIATPIWCCMGCDSEIWGRWIALTDPQSLVAQIRRGLLVVSATYKKESIDLWLVNLCDAVGGRGRILRQDWANVHVRSGKSVIIHTGLESLHLCRDLCRLPHPQRARVTISHDARLGDASRVYHSALLPSSAADRFKPRSLSLPRLGTSVLLIYTQPTRNGTN